MSSIEVFSDGGARGNPGPAGIGVLIRKEDGVIKEISEYIGEATNNQAEYRALIAALEWVSKNCEEVDKIVCFLDSELVVKQLKGEYKMKNEGLKPLFSKAQGIVSCIGVEIDFIHIPREKNKRADELVNKAIDMDL